MLAARQHYLFLYILWRVATEGRRWWACRAGRPIPPLGRSHGQLALNLFHLTGGLIRAYCLPVCLIVARRWPTGRLVGKIEAYKVLNGKRTPWDGRRVHAALAAGRRRRRRWRHRDCDPSELRKEAARVPEDNNKVPEQSGSSSGVAVAAVDVVSCRHFEWRASLKAIILTGRRGRSRHGRA